jgi:hypothetical protein
MRRCAAFRRIRLGSVLACERTLRRRRRESRDGPEKEMIVRRALDPW